MPARTKTGTSKLTNIQDKLLEALGEVDRPGDVCASGDRPLVMPGLEVEGLGAVGLPLTKTQAKKLSSCAGKRRMAKGPIRLSILMCGAFGNSTPHSSS